MTSYRILAMNQKQGPSPANSMDRPEDTAVTTWEGTKKTSSNHDYWRNTPQFSKTMVY